MTHPIKDMLAELKQERDELRVQMHLAKAEIKDEWKDLESKWTEMESRMKNSGKEMMHALDQRTEVLGEELRSAYQKLRDKLVH